MNFLAVGNKSLELRKFILASPCVPIINGYLASAIRYSKGSKLNHFTLLTVKIKYDSVDGECKKEISHADDLVDIFGTEIMAGNLY